MTNTALLKRTLGERLAKARRIAGLGQQDIADLLTVSRRTVVRWENDEGFPRVDQVERWAEITDAPIVWILRDDEALGGGGVTGSVSVRYPNTGGVSHGYPPTREFSEADYDEPFSPN